MTVQELINTLNVLCEGRNLAEIEVQTIKYYSEDQWPSYETPVVESYGGSNYPFIITIG